MNAERYTFDTSILFYALDPDASEKYHTAQRLIASADSERAVLLLQTLSELCNSVRKKRPALVEEVHRWVLQSMVFFDVKSATPADLADAILAQQQHNLPFWDAMLWATARRAGCTLFLTEGLQDGRTLGGVVFRNPFKLSSSALNELLA